MKMMFIQQIPNRKEWRRIAAIVVAFSFTGCLHTTNVLPGVLDMRTDGSGAAAGTPVPASAARTGFDGFAYGNGGTGGTDVVIEDRAHFAIALVPIFNESSTEEWQAALGDGALTNIVIADQFSVMTFVVSFVKGLIPFVGSFITSTADHRVTAKRVQATSGGSSAHPPPAATESY